MLRHPSGLGLWGLRLSWGRAWALGLKGLRLYGFSGFRDLRALGGLGCRASFRKTRRKDSTTDIARP